MGQCPDREVRFDPVVNANERRDRTLATLTGLTGGLDTLKIHHLRC
jgi:hypothetical protein